MSQANIDVIKRIFKERLTAMKLIGSTNDVRMKRLNALMKSAISNILRSSRQKKHELHLQAEPMYDGSHEPMNSI